MPAGIRRQDPVIILDDADIDISAAETAPAQFRNSGQVCASPGRFFVHEKVYDKFMEKFIEATKKMTVGDPTDWKTMIARWVSKSTPGYGRRLYQIGNRRRGESYLRREKTDDCAF